MLIPGSRRHNWFDLMMYGVNLSPAPDSKSPWQRTRSKYRNGWRGAGLKGKLRRRKQRAARKEARP